MLTEAYLHCASGLFEDYSLQQPLHLYLKGFFSRNTKYGSRDRTAIADLLFGLYRLGHASDHLSVRQRLILGAWMYERLHLVFFERVWPELNRALPSATGSERRAWAREQGLWLPEENFPLSENISSPLAESVFSPVRVFTRIRQHMKANVQHLREAGIDVQTIGPATLAFQANVKLEGILPAADYVVQDLASQRVASLLEPQAGQTWWDCCAASGGKSIMLLDQQPDVHLTVSDVRPGILENLKARLKLYHPGKHYAHFVGDVSKPLPQLRGKLFDVVLCDAPCSGSGTWSRSPEQYYFFSKEKLNDYIGLQRSILRTALAHLKPGGRLIYVTCSVFRAENEEQTEHLQEQGNMLLRQQLFDEHAAGGDALFAAVLTRKH